MSGILVLTKEIQNTEQGGNERKDRTFKILDLDCDATVEFATRKWLLECIEDYIENLGYGYDMSDTAYEILYRDGTTDYINEEYDGHKIRKINIATIIEHNPCTDVVFGDFEMNEYGVTTPAFETVISEDNIMELA